MSSEKNSKKYKTHRNIDVDESGDVGIASRVTLHGWFVYNAAASVRYLKLYNSATAPTVGTDTPKLTIPIPPGTGANVEIAGGVEFTVGVGLGATTGVADNDTGAPAANDVVVNLWYL